jgi:hypothetical protein
MAGGNDFLVMVTLIQCSQVEVTVLLHDHVPSKTSMPKLLHKSQSVAEWKFLLVFKKA